jgi:uncharacterized protein
MAPSLLQVQLTPRQLDTVLEILEAHLPTTAVRAFGSRATGKAKPHSDLDLLVMAAEPLPPRQRGRLLDAFEEASLPFRVDVVEGATCDAETLARFLQGSVPVHPRS